MGLLDGEVVSITGGGRGKGRAHAVVSLPIDAGHLALADISTDPK